MILNCTTIVWVTAIFFGLAIDNLKVYSSNFFDSSFTRFNSRYNIKNKPIFSKIDFNGDEYPDLLIYEPSTMDNKHKNFLLFLIKKNKGNFFWVAIEPPLFLKAI